MLITLVQALVIVITDHHTVIATHSGLILQLPYLKLFHHPK